MISPQNVKSLLTVVLLVWLAIISLVSIIVTAVDKYKAIRHSWRIKESTLLILSALGGSVAMFVTMQIIRHKTKKLKFMLGIPAIFIFQAALVVCIYMVLNNVWG
ncbi:MULTISPECIES: DUF1294 domain-containing protein [unclassified Ruminococcus]|uniref:DUF1294 domain-containing protein n=1 Tax=unclassified Ruminococcus TaxID=2608920 RepID=UPI002109403B|nr:MULTISPECIES: DUF1294 domain-containing protein [unclassified Ruminococcus]MCQ4021883.1 DUF1294 domain-containing protein [Ruminococcus sp. zg-924]MCQ4114328.1 DUF1294 domain-containing protein [Ruminococcus sp. zg-921]